MSNCSVAAESVDNDCLLRALRALKNGDFSVRLAPGEGAIDRDVARAFNELADTGSALAGELKRCAHEVAVQGELGSRPAAAGFTGRWRDMADDVGRVTGVLATQVRLASRSAQAMAEGDFSRELRGDERGELGGLRDALNRMSRQLLQATQRNSEENWLNTNLAKCIRLLQARGDLASISRGMLCELSGLLQAHGAYFYARSAGAAGLELQLLSTHDAELVGEQGAVMRVRERLVEECCQHKRRVLETAAGPDGLMHWVTLPVLFEGEIHAIVQLATPKPLGAGQLALVDQLAESIGILINMMEANARTGELLEQSQTLTGELQNRQEALKLTNDRLERQAEGLRRSESLLRAQQDDLRRSNEELQRRAKLLSEQMEQVERRNREVEQARAMLEEKAEQLALSSRYKSEFLANMSHELRTPLNSLLILAKILAQNAGANLSHKQVEYAHTIYAAGTDLLSLINDILDLAKIESGTVTVHVDSDPFSELKQYVERTFRQIAQHKGLQFEVEIDPALPEAIQTDGKRLQQVLKNLLSNAFKFTERGAVSLKIARVDAGWTGGHAELDRNANVVAFSVSDTGIGIPQDKQGVIFEAFRQADGTTSRRFGGTGLGLSISRELARLLGGQIRVTSAPGKGSTFVLYLPLTHRALEAEAKAHPARGMAGHAEARAPAAPQRGWTRAAPKAPSAEVGKSLVGRKVLVVDDDIRNIFALTASLEQYGLVVMNAESGKDGIETLKTEPGIEAVLMDIMMPELDGYDTIRIIRSLERFRNIPIIAITAQAMKEDRDKCLEAGATEYLSKPVNTDQLALLLRGLLVRGAN
jgi:signal transduction histidine kinase/HAMP domain-containing protein